MRADGWNRIPLIRMTNINMLPVPGMSLDEIVADTDDGLYLATNRSWSIDDRRLNFQFATEVAYEIKGGKKGRLFKNPTYTGITYEFWRSCDAVGDERELRDARHAELRQGRARPDGRVGHAVPGARFRERPGRGGQVVASDGRRIDDRAARRARARREGPRTRPCGVGATEAEVLVMAERLRADPVRQQRDPPERRRASVTVNLRYVVGRGSGWSRPAGSTTRASRARRAGRRDRRSGEELEDWGGLPEAGPIGDRRRRLVARRPPTATPEFRAEGVRAVIAAADAAGVAAYGSFSTDAEAIAVANSEGIRAAQRADHRPAADRPDGPDGGTGYAEAVAMDATDRRRGDRARGRREGPRHRRTRSRSTPATTRSCSRSTPSSTSSTCSATSASPPSRSRRSASFSEPGRRIGSDLVTIVDDGRRPGRAADGVRLRGRRQAARRRWSSAGVCRDVVYDAQTAARAGRRSTGHGLPAPNPYGPVPAQRGHVGRRRRRATSSSAASIAACS